MRKLKYVFYLTLVLMFLYSCDCRKNKTSNTNSCEIDDNTTLVGKILEGEHELRKLNTITKNGQEWSGGYFLIAGSASGKEVNKKMATFSWKMNNGDYALSEIEATKIRIRLDNSIETPYIIFRWIGGDITDINDILKYKVRYIVLVCNEADYPVNLNIDEL